MNKPPFESFGIGTIIAIRHSVPESGLTRSVLSEEGEEKAQKLAELVKKYLTKDGEGVIILHSHQQRSLRKSSSIQNMNKINFSRFVAVPYV